MYRIFLILLIVCVFTSCLPESKRILVFTKTSGHRHISIDAGKTALIQLGNENRLKIDTTEDPSFFREERLREYSAVIFLNTSNDVLNEVQQADFERYIQAGGGFVGVHGAAATEYDWPWYGKLVGAYFQDHPEIQPATLVVTSENHTSTDLMDTAWVLQEEWYNFRNMAPGIQVLMKVDESSYQGGTHGDEHPVSWYQEYDGGRSFYTNIGHRPESFTNAQFRQHLLGGILYAIGDNRRDYKRARSERIPDESRFTKEVLDFNLNEPMELDVIPGKGILFVERKGQLKFYSFQEKSSNVIAEIDVFHENEDGLLGLAVDPNYATNNWIYLFYSPAVDEPIQRLSRFDLIGDSLHHATEKILFTVPVIRECCHSGGSLEFDENGNLFIGIGDNTNPFESSGYAPIDERPERALWDAQKSSANTNDLRGKILRIKPEENGTYSIPDGNLFPAGTPNTRPEIYIMGSRNPFRFSIDSETGYVYWGDIGPDAGESDPNRGPEGLGEFDQARQPGFWGWPYTRGNNQVYYDYDFSTDIPGQKFDPDQLVNQSPNNTGMQTLPPAEPSMIWYGYARSDRFPWLGDGGVNPMAGPVYHAEDYENTVNYFPEYFEGKLFVYEWMRDWIYVIGFDENHNFLKADPFMPGTEFSHPMDMIIGPDGVMYILEYGQSWFSRNLDARLSQIKYNPGNRAPMAVINADQEVGGVPLSIQFSGRSSIDYDNDPLEFEWSISGAIHSREPEPTLLFDSSGVYLVTLKVTDPKGMTSTSTMKIVAGNDPPDITLEMETDIAFYDDVETLGYKAIVVDREDGTTEDGSINPELVKVTFTYVPEGQDEVIAAIGHQQNVVPRGKLVIDASDCNACHAIDKKVNGPSYLEIATRYTENDKGNLVSNIIRGSSGIWGETMMSAHPQLSMEEVEGAVILSLGKEEKPPSYLPLSGTLEFSDHINSEGDGRYVLMVSYLDQGNPDIPESSLSVMEKVMFVRSPKSDEEDTDIRIDVP